MSILLGIKAETNQTSSKPKLKRIKCKYVRVF